VVRLNTQMQELRADIAKTTDADRRKRLETLLKDVQAIAARAQEQRSRALRDLERYGAQR
jgi:L-lactate utilization protein LutB